MVMHSQGMRWWNTRRDVKPIVSSDSISLIWVKHPMWVFKKNRHCVPVNSEYLPCSRAHSESEATWPASVLSRGIFQDVSYLPARCTVRCLPVSRLKLVDAFQQTLRLPFKVFTLYPWTFCCRPSMYNSFGRVRSQRRT